MRTRGVGATTLDDVVSSSNVSKSQFYRHFSDKPQLVRAVIEHVGAETIARERNSLHAVANLEDLRRWKEAIVAINGIDEGRYGCALGSLANQVSDHDAIAREQFDELFTAWRELFEDLLRRFQRDRILPDEADVDRLAIGFVAAIQGGYLLAQTARDVTLMAAAIESAIEHLGYLASRPNS
jgi:AcrR family transcriptional regulator